MTFSIKLSLCKVTVKEFSPLRKVLAAKKPSMDEKRLAKARQRLLDEVQAEARDTGS